jgi:hypothetical protein
VSLSPLEIFCSHCTSRENVEGGMKQRLFQELLHAAHQVYSSTDALQQFAPWPSDLLYVDRPVQPVPAIRQIKKWSDAHPLHIAT